MPIGEGETREQYFKRLESAHWQTETLFDLDEEEEGVEMAEAGELTEIEKQARADAIIEITMEDRGAAIVAALDEEPQASLSDLKSVYKIVFPPEEDIRLAKEIAGLTMEEKAPEHKALVDALLHQFNAVPEDAASFMATELKAMGKGND